MLTGDQSTEQMIYDRLVALLESHHEEGSIVIIYEPQSRKFVQFGPGWTLIMDVPCVALSRDEADRASRFFANLGVKFPIEYDAPNPKTGRVAHGATFNADFEKDARAAAQATVGFFREVYLMAGDLKLMFERR